MVPGTLYWCGIYLKSKLLELVYILQPLLQLSGHYTVFSDETLTATAYLVAGILPYMSINLFEVRLIGR